MKYFEITINNKDYKMRLTSEQCVQLEKHLETKLLDYIQDYSVQTIVTLLRNLIDGKENVRCSERMAYDIYDDLIDEGYTIETILMNVIYPALAVSGVMSQEQIDFIKNKAEAHTEGLKKAKN